MHALRFIQHTHTRTHSMNVFGCTRYSGTLSTASYVTPRVTCVHNDSLHTLTCNVNKYSAPYAANASTFFGSRTAMPYSCTTNKARRVSTAIDTMQHRAPHFQMISPVLCAVSSCFERRRHSTTTHTNTHSHDPVRIGHSAEKVSLRLQPFGNVAQQTTCACFALKRVVQRELTADEIEAVSHLPAHAIVIPNARL
jgi:hypothetical protein